MVVGPKKNLSARGLLADRINLLASALPGEATAKIRYAQGGAACWLTLEGGTLRVLFDAPQEAVTPGQSVVLYAGTSVLGGGIIKEVVQ